MTNQYLLNIWKALHLSFFFVIYLEHISLGALGDSFYEYLLKAWIQSGQLDKVPRQMYDEAMEALVNNIIQTSPNGLIYASDMKCKIIPNFIL